MIECIYAVFGASGFGREVMPLLRAQINSKDIKNLYFVDDSPTTEEVNGLKVLSFDEFVDLEAKKKYISIAIADSSIRIKLTERCINVGINILDIKADNSVIMDDVSIGEGSIISPFCTLTSNIKIGVGFHANIYSYVAHDCNIGDYVTFAPSVKCNGNIRIENYAYIGTGAILKQGTPDKPLVIGEGAVVGMGAVVTKSVAAGDVVFGNPAKSFKRKNR
ncbi:acetyltransferase [Colwellia ponticola]|uniref:Acetyltransferase n=1 Tax=Colwellia ponticola TaxID=2304625 RepID=A0A8H2JNB5_9GAMM|nr:acetyltransferase [Colwellia ponticola]TMM46380.1 acetyltransferase [Colwellia ponticola]